MSGGGARARARAWWRDAESLRRSQGIWTKTIGYDPYAGQAEVQDQAAAKQEEENTAMRAKGIMEVAKLQNKDNGDGERSQDFAKQLFWGLKRKAPPVGHEYAAVREDDSSSDDDDDDDDEEERIAQAAREAARAKAAGVEVGRSKRARDDSDSDDRKERKRAKKERKRARKEEKKRRKEKKAKKEKKRD